MKARLKYLVILLPVILVLCFTQCRKQEFTEDPNAMLGFSSDSILFDTVFSTIGSTTQVLKVFNRNNQDINISNIYIEGGTDSEFRMNVDGISGYSHQNVEISANDSMFIFVEVTINPNVEFLPFIVEDRIKFETNGNEQSVLLNAYGQNAYFHGSLDDLTSLPDEELLWDNSLPHVVYGIVQVDSAKTLTILPGTQVYVHAGSGILCYKSKIDVQGFLNSEVVFQGDRLEQIYSDEPGQWGIELTFNYESNFGIEQATITRGGIWLFESTGSTIDYAIIKNGVIGVQVDTTGTTGNALEMTNTIVENMSAIGLFAQQGNIFGYNNLVANCGQTCAQFTIGGQYQMYHCTFANYWPFSNRQSPTFVLNNYYVDIDNNLQIRPLVDTKFEHCIMYGDNANQSDYNEFIVDLQEDGFPEYEFISCLVDTDQAMEAPNYFDMRNGNTPTFQSPNSNNFDLVENNVPSYMSAISGPSFSVSGDIEGVFRTSNELGAYSSIE